MSAYFFDPSYRFVSLSHLSPLLLWFEKNVFTDSRFKSLYWHIIRAWEINHLELQILMQPKCQQKNRNWTLLSSVSSRCTIKCINIRVVIAFVRSLFPDLKINDPKENTIYEILLQRHVCIRRRMKGKKSTSVVNHLFFPIPFHSRLPHCSSSFSVFFSGNISLCVLCSLFSFSSFINHHRQNAFCLVVILLGWAKRAHMHSVHYFMIIPHIRLMRSNIETEKMLATKTA